MATTPLQQMLDRALQHHRSGQLQQAEHLYRQILSQQPNHPDVLHNLGILAHQVGRHDAAIELIKRAIAHRPQYAEACYNLASIFMATGRFDQAITASRQAIALRAAFPDAFNNLGNALSAKGEFDEAIAAYRQAIALNPRHAEAHNNLGNALERRGSPGEAIYSYRQSVTANPNSAEAWSNLGNALKDTGSLDEAIAAHRRAIAIRPDLAEAHNNLGSALSAKGEMDEAIAACQKAISLRPDFASAYTTLGIALKGKGRIDEAVAAYRQALALRPGFPEAHNNLAHGLFLRGDFEPAWIEYEWRWKCVEFRRFWRSFDQPQWDGRALPNQTLLIHTEQGLGDSLQFIRYLPLLRGKVGKILLMCQPELQALFRENVGDVRCITPDDSLPPFDVHCPLLSLPGAFKTALQSIPGSVPYLCANSQKVERWRERLAIEKARLKIGLAWAGGANHKNDSNRSIPLSLLSPLARIPNVTFFSLQKGAASTQAKNPPPRMKLIDWTDELNDFSETAALIANLDLVISVDTAVAHLAGAMAKPVWVLLPFLPDWRWMMNRADSPWYPTMRLFRQTNRGRWDPVIEQVCAAVQSFPQSSRPDPN